VSGTNGSIASARKPRLFYGVNSEGMGHATRSLPLIERLNENWEVHVFCGGRVRDFLAKRLPRVHDHFFIPLVYRDNKMLVGASFRAAFARAPAAFLCGFRLIARIWREQPVAIVTDYEFITTWVGAIVKKKVLCVDNNHLIVYGDLPAPRDAQEAKEKSTVVTATQWNVPFADMQILTTFWQPPLMAHVDPARVKFAPCAVRDVVVSRRDRIRYDGPVLVYQTSSTNHRLPAVLSEAAAKSGLKFAVYGSGQPAGVVGNVEYKAFSEDTFLDDLAAAPFVVINGGHTTIVEALTLNKPILAEPVLLQYEQKANVLGLERLGVGRGVDVMTADDIVKFAQEAPACRAKAEALDVVDTARLARAVEDAVRDLTGFVAPHRAAELTAANGARA
jgi:uncharacterized protein (TIGR00661 family)